MDRRIRKVMEVLETEWRGALRVSDLAAQVGLGASRLEHLFKEEAQISIREFVRERRLAAAASMLELTEERVSSIGYSVGFPDVSNFNHAFKKKFGVCPGEFRVLHHEHAGNGHGNGNGNVSRSRSDQRLAETTKEKPEPPSKSN